MSSKHSKRDGGHHSKSGKAATPTPPPLIFGPDSYNLTEGDQIPQPFFEKVIHRAYIEFFSVSTEGMTLNEASRVKNHAIWKFDFTTPYGDYRGARLSMDVNFDIASSPSESGASFKPGGMMVKPVMYTERSTSSARTIEIPCATGLLLGYVTFHLMNNRLHEFSFVNINDRYYGCRDWMTQSLLLLGQVNYTGSAIIRAWPQDNPPMPANDAYEALGMRYRVVPPRGEAHGCPIDLGHFLEYNRVIMDCMPYQGTVKAAALCERVP
ncbi:hypothetical protein DV735_g5243, partial [Chaetothyriales sp. CBS 134920]